MPASNRRPRSALAIVLASLTLLFASLWLLSTFRCFSVLHTGGALVRNTQTPDGQMGAWEYTLTTRGLQTYPHQLRLVRVEYLSVMSAEAEKDRFSHKLRWEAFSFSPKVIGRERRPWFSWQPSDWRILGFGTGKSAFGGYISRTIDLPYWLLIVAFGTPFAILEHRRRTLLQREYRGQCIACGYQLDDAMIKCPECGTIRSSAHAAP